MNKRFAKQTILAFITLTLKPEANRAERAVGSTWLRPPK